MRLVTSLRVGKEESGNGSKTRIMAHQDDGLLRARGFLKMNAVMALKHRSRPVNTAARSELKGACVNWKAETVLNMKAVQPFVSRRLNHSYTLIVLLPGELLEPKQGMTEIIT